MKATIVEFRNSEHRPRYRLRGLMFQDGGYSLLLAQTEPGDLTLRFYENTGAPSKFVSLCDDTDLLSTEDMAELGVPDLSEEALCFLFDVPGRQTRLAQLKENVAALLLRA